MKLIYPFFALLILNACQIHVAKTQSTNVPLTEKSNISIIERTDTLHGERYVLSNRVELDEKQLQIIRTLSHYFSDEPRVTELLTWMEIQYDYIDDKYIIKPRRYADGFGEPYLYNYIVLDRGKPELRTYLKYQAKNWLFVESFTIASDDLRWRSPRYKFSRDHSGGKIWEWIDVVPEGEFYRSLDALSDSEIGVIRFYGENYKYDWTISKISKRNLKNIFELYRLMKVTS